MSAWHGPAHEHWEDATGAYALGALPEDEAKAFEAHLAECPGCRAEVEELRTAIQALPASLAPIDPPATLRHRLMDEVHREAELLAAAGPEADRPPRRRRAALRLPRPRWLPAAAAAVALGVGVIVGVVIAGGGPESRTVALTAAPRLGGANVRLTISGGEAMLTADHLPPPPDNRVYQVWVERRGGHVQPTAALFVPRADGSATVGLPGMVADSQAVMISAEPRGGSPAPTTDPVLTATLSTVSSQ